ncbi:hypothetical protein D3C71_1211440 [compost metagenome]
MQRCIKQRKGFNFISIQNSRWQVEPQKRSGDIQFNSKTIFQRLLEQRLGKPTGIGKRLEHFIQPGLRQPGSLDSLGQGSVRGL